MNKQYLEEINSNYKSPEFIEYYNRAYNNHVYLKKQVVRDLYSLYEKNKDYVKNRLFEANMFLVIKVAIKYCNEQTYDIFDLIQEGNLGLIRAIENFNPYSEELFSSHAYRLIRNYIMHFINENLYSIKLPYSVIRRNIVIDDYIYLFEQENGREPTNNELINIYSVMESELDSYNMSRLYINPVEEVDINMIDNGLYTSLETICLNNTLKRKFNSVIESLELSARNLSIFKLYFAIDHHKSFNIVEIASMFNISKQRVSQIINVISSKLKYSEEFQNLLIYIDLEPKRYSDTKNLVKSYKPSKTVYEQFSKYSHPDIDFVLQFIMSTKDEIKQLIFKRYGLDFNKRYSSEECKLYNRIVYSYIYRYLIKLKIEPSYYINKTINTLDENMKPLLEGLLKNSTKEVQDIFDLLLIESSNSNFSLESIININEEDNKYLKESMFKVLYNYYEKVYEVNTLEEGVNKVRKAHYE